MSAVGYLYWKSGRLFDFPFESDLKQQQSVKGRCCWNEHRQSVGAQHERAEPLISMGGVLRLKQEADPQPRPSGLHTHPADRWSRERKGIHFPNNWLLSSAIAMVMDGMQMMGWRMSYRGKRCQDALWGPVSTTTRSREKCIKDEDRDSSQTPSSYTDWASVRVQHEQPDTEPETGGG